MRFEPWLRRYSACSFFALAFAISLGGILIVMGTTDFDLVDLKPLDTGLIFVLMLLGPSVSGLALTAVLEGLGFRCCARTRPLSSARPDETARNWRISSPMVNLTRNAGEFLPRTANARTQTKSAQQVGEFAATIESPFEQRQ